MSQNTIDSRLQQELSNCIQETNFTTARKLYRAKVRDCYIGTSERIIIASDRISAFDHIFDEPIPFKGQVLNQIAVWSLKQTEDIIDNHIIEIPDPNVTIGTECEPIKLEVIIRGYLAGHAWREYKSGKRTLCGISLPEGMKENEKFPKPIFTPSTKADEGHDEDISKEEAISQGLITQELYEKIEDTAQQLFQRGTEIAQKRGLILVDTKYEFGIREGKLYLIDEIHTPDSSRYFYADGYEERLENNEKQKQLSKEFVREWLMNEHNFQGKEGQKKPSLPDDFRILIAKRYIELYEHLTGENFTLPEEGNAISRIEKNIAKWL